MKYSDIKLLRQMMDQKIAESKITDFFTQQGYSEREITREIQDYERESRSAAAMKSIAEMPSFSGERAAVVHSTAVQRKDETMKKVMTLFLVLALVVLALAAMYIVLTRSL